MQPTDNIPKAQSLIDITALLSAGAAQSEPVQVAGFTPVIIVPDGYSVKPLDFEELPPLRDHIRQHVRIADLDSFTAYVKRYQTAQTLIFAVVKAEGATFTAVFDYHFADKDKPQTTTQENRAAHRAAYPCPTSHEWQQWFSNNGKAMSQEVFAHFIDANIPDITAPDSAALLELILNFEAKSSVSFSSEVKPQSGARALKYVETIEGSGNTTNGVMKVPEQIELNIPVFYGGKRFAVSAKLFYRPSGGKLSISYELRRPHEVVDLAIKDVVKDITASTGITPLLGTID